MKPTLVIHDNNIGPEHVRTQLEKLKVPLKTFGDYSPTIEGTDSLIREMAVYFNKEEQGEALCNELNIDIQKAMTSASSAQVC